MSEEVGYFDSLPEEVKPFAKVGDTDEIKPVSQFASDINDAFNWMGNSLRLPGPDADPDSLKGFQEKVMEKVPGLSVIPNAEDQEAMSAHFAKLGRPDAADSYKAPDSVQIDGEQLGQLKSIAFKANMTQQQFTDYLTTWNDANTSAVQQSVLAHEEAIATLKGEWGAAYDERVAEITAFLKTNATTPPSVIEQLQQGGLPADHVRWLHSIADAVSNEDGQFHQQGSNDNPNMLDHSEAAMRAQEVTNRMMDVTNPPSADEMAILAKKAEAYEYMAMGQRPPAELMRYVS